VEWLALSLLLLGGMIFLFGDGLAGLVPDSSTVRGWGGIGNSGAVTVMALFGSILCVVVGLSLFLVRPLLMLGPRVPFWLVPIGGALIFWFDDPVCVAFYPGDIHSRGLYDCRNNLPLLGIVILLFGIILLVRRSQIFRKPALSGNETNR
jgi:hypothetical protein